MFYFERDIVVVHVCIVHLCIVYTRQNADDIYLGGKCPTGDRVLRSRLVVQSKVQGHLVPLVFVRKWPSSQVDAWLTAIVHSEDEALAHIT